MFIPPEILEHAQRDPAIRLSAETAAAYARSQGFRIESVDGEDELQRNPLSPCASRETDQPGSRGLMLQTMWKWDHHSTRRGMSACLSRGAKHFR